MLKNVLVGLAIGGVSLVALYYAQQVGELKDKVDNYRYMLNSMNDYATKLEIERDNLVVKLNKIEKSSKLIKDLRSSKQR